ncbi:SpoIID/LytB domain-containing protein [Paenibacillus sediminis]|uniref:Stage II sporulation protein D n=1 Tax=Paenibacillus sediminis TaxID=664909 RepID=A0ABS4GXZ9_9BACL|nr:SpoIID/LytB domain-containing protein [Paenibacillus sediminis]MBP1935149.1 stage II sporulation protein D [Paenibacillus sediminis]
MNLRNLHDKKRTNHLVGSYRWGKVLLAVILLIGCLQLPAYADSGVPTLDRIRVAMFLDLGSKYKSTTAAVTLKSAGQWFAALGSEGGAGARLSFTAGQTARFSVDSYRVKVLETTDWMTAAKTADKLKATADKPILFSASRGGQTVYQLYTGMYATELAAQDAASRIKTSVASYLGGGQPAVRGGLHLQAGIYNSEAEASAAMNSITSAGFDAFVAVEPIGGVLQYAVWVGEASNANDLNGIMTSLTAQVPGLNVTTVDPAQAALIERQDVSLDLTTPQPVKHYMVSGNGQKLVITGNDDGIQVVERSGRTYRGDFEISSYNGQLALVNELPFEQYLYSVVGGEAYSSWPQEALKAQAVAARSYALFQGMKFDIANVVDTTLSQAYNGIAAEHPSVIQAVDATKGEVLMSDGKLVETIFSSNSGGYTADPSEVWNNGGSVFSSKQSDADQSALQNTLMWYYVLLSNGKTGYIREDNTVDAGMTAAGLRKLTVTSSGTNVRVLPLIQSTVDPIAKLNPGDQAIILNKVPQSGDYAWIRGPFTSDQLVKSLQGKTTTPVPSSIASLEVTQRGPSGRAIEIKANGQVLGVKYPDMFRSAFGSLPSTLFDIVPTGSYTIRSAEGASNSKQPAGTVILSASGQTTWNGGTLVVMNGQKTARAVDSSQGFVFIGKGNGHGLGLSQWGAKGLADQGYDYQMILKYYYNNVDIVKG